VTRHQEKPSLRLHGSATVRGLLLAAGSLCVGLGLLGLVFPVLPTTPFLLLAAACYARASERFHSWLVHNAIFGPIIQEWQRHRSLPYRTKVNAIALMLLTLGVSIVFFVSHPMARVLLAVLGAALALYLYRIPSRDRPGGNFKDSSHGPGDTA
jgi:uncharacterized membrane protein YbaN (DUF454 family)